MSSQGDSMDSLLSRFQFHLQRQRYSAEVIRKHVHAVRRFFSYLEVKRIAVGEVSPLVLGAYLRRMLRRYRKRHGHSPPDGGGWKPSLLAPVHILLRLVLGKWPPPSVPRTRCEIFQRRICDGFVRWLTDIRALVSTDVADHCTRARQFLGWLSDRGCPPVLKELTVADVDAYVSARAASLGRASRKRVSTCLRNFLRYLYWEGLIQRDLAPAVLSPIIYTFEGIPAALSDEDVARVLKTTRADRTPIGARDFAILLLLSTYGLRSGEVVRLRLEDVDWRHDYLRIRRTKTGVVSMLPLFKQVGDAILRYLRQGRPSTEAREIFVWDRAPHRPFRGGGSLHGMVVKRLRAAGVQSFKQVPRAFRHARAMSLLRSAVPLKTIGDILGHRSPSSTLIYLKLATGDLRSVALEVPEVTP